MFFKEKKKTQIKSMIEQLDVLDFKNLTLLVNPPGFEREKNLYSHWSLKIEKEDGDVWAFAIEHLQNYKWGVKWYGVDKKGTLILSDSKDKTFLTELSANLQILAKEGLYAHFNEVKKLDNQSHSLEENLLNNEVKSLEWLKASFNTLNNAFNKVKTNDDLLYSAALLLNSKPNPRLRFDCYNLHFDIHWHSENNTAQMLIIDSKDSTSEASPYEATWSALRENVLIEMTKFLGNFAHLVNPLKC